MSIQYLEHATDAFVEVTASSLDDAFTLAGQSVVDITLDRKTIEEKEERQIVVSGKDLRHLLLNWLEEVNYQLITEGFAIARFSLDISKQSEYELKSAIYGEPIDLKKHHFKVEIKAPTFHMMEIKQNGQVTMRFLLDL
ncbi:MAG TPA: archease [Nitrosopumilaceae archaeon]|nr:archease [Nitrosopumilaceae archaeon]